MDREPQEAVPLTGEIQRAILESGLSLNQLGKSSGVSQGQLSRFVHGNRTLTLPAADRLCRFFGLKLVKEPEKPDKTTPST